MIVSETRDAAPSRLAKKHTALTLAARLHGVRQATEAPLNAQGVAWREREERALLDGLDEYLRFEDFSPEDRGWLMECAAADAEMDAPEADRLAKRREKLAEGIENVAVDGPLGRLLMGARAAVAMTGRTRRDIATDVGISPTSLMRKLTGSRSMSLEQFAAVLAATGALERTLEAMADG